MARKILLADDSVTAQNMGRKILADAGYEVITVNNGSAALKKITEARPDLIVLDVYMPGYSGLEVCQRLKENADTARIPILLTVGKLEPFKPEEAKRVRAEGFIVKPFEASELLSALTKLEDKMVPRSESSKPGRFARTIAVVEEGRYDKTMAADEDSGWKNRISFPSKKKDKAAEQEDHDDSAIYNPVNKDLRTVVETKPSTMPEAKTHEPKAEERRVDLAALAPEGLPKDVTPEEIAALAAAAAQMQGKIAEAKSPETKIEEPKVDQRQEENTKIAEVKAKESVAEQPSSIVQAVSLQSEKSEEKFETKPETQPAASEPIAATFAEQKQEQEKEKKAESVSDASSVPAPTIVEVAAAINALETPGSSIASASSSNDRETPHDLSRQAEPEPVTMALAAAAAQGTTASRWTAVSVAVAPEESGITLEDEMRKSYAAYAVPVGVESRPAPAEPASAAQPNSEAAISEASVAPVAAIATPEPTQPIPAAIAAEPEVTQSASAVTSTVSEEISGRVKSFETIAPHAVAPPATQAEPERSWKPVTAQTSESATSASEVSLPPEPERTEARTEEFTVVAGVISESPAETVSSASEPKANEPQKYEESVDTKLDTLDTKEESHREESVPSVTAEIESAANSTQAAEARETVPASESPAMSPVTAEPAPSNEPVSKAKHDVPNKESEIAATTAAAWASWRRIRESDPKDAGPSLHTSEESSDSHDEAAMAVAAGAEKAPEEGPEIASIVDSVLADLRPKIVEEISKKLKKK